MPFVSPQGKQFLSLLTQQRELHDTRKLLVERLAEVDEKLAALNAQVFQFVSETDDADSHAGTESDAVLDRSIANH